MSSTRLALAASVNSVNIIAVLSGCRNTENTFTDSIAIMRYRMLQQ